MLLGFHFLPRFFDAAFLPYSIMRSLAPSDFSWRFIDFLEPYFSPLADIYLPFFLAAYMLSIRLGYGLPAFLARALAADFWDGVNFLDLPPGLGVSHIGLDFLAATDTPESRERGEGFPSPQSTRS